MITTKEKLSEAIKSGQSRIIVGGELANEIIRKNKRKRNIKIGSVTLLIGSLAAIPFTGGVSTLGVATAMGLTVGSFTISTAELFLLCGTTVALAGLSNGYNVKFDHDTVILEKK